jgi:hypothetical protein
LTLKVKLDLLGEPQQDFYQVKNNLLLNSCKFDANTLSTLSYNQLVLAAINPAGDTICDLKLIQDEKRQRRERFLSMSEENLLMMKNYLIIERMWDDIHFERNYNILPNWNNLTERQKIWLRLNCIVNHIDNPNTRLFEVIVRLNDCISNGTLPYEISNAFMVKIKGLIRLYPKLIDDNTFRDRVTIIAALFFQYLSQDEAKQIENEEIKNYSCVSDCYRILYI